MRVFDILLALVALLFFAPLLLVIAAAVYVSDPGAILFAQATRSISCSAPTRPMAATPSFTAPS